MKHMQKTDWRIGLKVTAKYQHCEFYGIAGEVIGVHPSGTLGIKDPHGVMLVKLNNGKQVYMAADQLITA